MKNVSKFHLSRFVAPDRQLTVMQQRVYQMMFRNVDEFKKRPVKSGLVWSITLSILLSMNGESIMGRHYKQFYCRQLLLLHAVCTGESPHGYGPNDASGQPQTQLSVRVSLATQHVSAESWQPPRRRAEGL